MTRHTSEMSPPFMPRTLCIEGQVLNEVFYNETSSVDPDAKSDE